DRSRLSRHNRRKLAEWLRRSPGISGANHLVMKSLLLASTLVALASTASAEISTAHPAARSDDRTLGTSPMSGPYESAFDEKCAEISGDTLHREATCTRVRALRLGAMRAEIHRIGWGDGSGDYYLALRTRAGWFVSEVPLQIETQDGHAGHFDVGRIASIKVA